jgi:hypothetical protein
MIIGEVATANIALNTIFVKYKSRVFAMLAKVEKELCEVGKTKAHVDIAIYNSALVYLTLIYTDVNTNTLSVRDTTYFQCKYNWTAMVAWYKCLGINIEEMANLINLFTKQSGIEYTELCA